uniref:T9SS type A sorting domain-containing protein n=1 Tax=candidate division WOR-3 bacterium TaxID=2052148 RepID=A0A7C4CC19_UNCW3
MPALASADTALWIAWRQKKGSGPSCVKVASHDGSQWQTPDSLSPWSPDAAAITVCLALDRANPWLVYDSYAQNDTVRLLYAFRSGDTWTSPRTLARDSIIWSYYPALTAHPEGGVQAVWNRQGYPWAWLYTARGTADSWTSPVLLDSFNAVMLRYEMAIADLIGSNKMMAVWFCTRDDENFDLWSSVGNNASWSRPIPVVYHDPPSDYLPQLSVTRAGNRLGDVRVFWQRSGSGIVTARYDRDQEQWVEPFVLDSAAEYSLGGHVCTDEHGWTWVTYRHVVWPHQRFFLRYHDGAGWSEPIHVPFVESTVTFTYVAAAHGRIWLFWVRRPSDTRSLLYYSSAGHPLAISERAVQPRVALGTMLADPVPSVFRTSAAICYSLNASARVSLAVHDATGRSVRTLLNSGQEPGRHAVHWDGRDDFGRTLGSGVYFCKFEAGGFTATRKLVKTE